MNKINVENKEDLVNLGSTITIYAFEEDIIPNFILFIKEYTPIKKEDVYITKGVTMNNELNLTGNNRYPDDLIMVSIRLEDIENPDKLIIPNIEEKLNDWWNRYE